MCEREMNLRDEIMDILQNLEYEQSKNITFDNDYKSAKEATNQILKAVEARLCSNDITWTKLGDRKFIALQEVKELLK